MDAVVTPRPLATGPAATPGQALVYLHDRDSEGVARQALSDLGVADVTFANAGIAEAIGDMKKRPSPKILIVDVANANDPQAAVTELVELCEPSTGIIAVGDANDIRLYRGLLQAGAVEYFFRPLVTSLLAHALETVVSGEHAPGADASGRTGKLIFVIGARGGCGATSVATRTAWALAEHPPRPVALVDLDLQSGDAALQLDATPNHALREALERADRVDDLFLERGAINVTSRLALLASLEPLEAHITFDEEALLSLLKMLRRRYRYVVVDIPVSRIPDIPAALHLPSLLLLVSDASLSSARDVARVRGILGPFNAERACLHLLNKSNAPGALSLEEFTRGAGQAPDILLPWSRDIAMAAKTGLKNKPDIAVFNRALSPVFARVAGVKPAPTSLLSNLPGLHGLG